MTTNQPPEHFTNAPLCTVNWDRDEVPEGYIEVTFLIPETGRRWSGRTIADLTIKDKAITASIRQILEEDRNA